MTDTKRIFSDPGSVLRLAIFTGGISAERSISLDSARTFYDGLRQFCQQTSLSIEPTLVFQNRNGNYLPMPKEWLYSNTTDDFEQNLASIQPYTDNQLRSLIADTDVLCPMIHGQGGEDGKLTALFEEQGNWKYIGSSSSSLHQTHYKHTTSEAILNFGLRVAKSALFNIPESSSETVIDDWINSPEAQHKLDIAISKISADRKIDVVVKPNDCGSSDGVSRCTRETLNRAVMDASRFSSQILIEEYIQGVEFSIIVLQDLGGNITPLLPTSIHHVDASGNTVDGIYSRLKKYHPDRYVRHETPGALAPFSIRKIRTQAKDLFCEFGLSDWARLDGFVLGDGSVIWSEINGIPGYGQDSFLFQQAALFGLGHKHITKLLIARALLKTGVWSPYGDDGLRKTPSKPAFDALLPADVIKNSLEQSFLWIKARDQEVSTSSTKKLFVIGGGSTSERNVSRLSWINVIQKLSSVIDYDVSPVFLSRKGQYWQVPLFVALQHTIEEIETIISSDTPLKDRIREYLTELEGLQASSGGNSLVSVFDPKPITLEGIKDQIGDHGGVFIALHGGIGEDGTLQSELEALQIPYNGSDPSVSAVCMDKVLTGESLTRMGIIGFTAPKKRAFTVSDIRRSLTECIGGEVISRLAAKRFSLSLNDFFGDQDWKKYCNFCDGFFSSVYTELGSPSGIVIKPRADGCSTGVLVADQPTYQVPIYVACALAQIQTVPLHWLYKESSHTYEQELKFPDEPMSELLFEQFIGGRDTIVEMTVGVVQVGKRLISLVPSATRSIAGALSVYEKFCKGFGTNLTPPPGIQAAVIRSIQDRVAEFATRLSIQGYARIDIIYDTESDSLFLIEVNTLPGLSAATVLFTQALQTPELKHDPISFLCRIARPTVPGERQQ
jgi:D-alanine--D-alanine ligase